MLKWTVVGRRDTDTKSDSIRSQSLDHENNKENSAKSSKRRRSSTSRRSLTTNRNSLNADKENQFTSTPIKSYDDHYHDVLRDVSNLTPSKDTAQRRNLSNKKIRTTSPTRRKKKKKTCLDPLHHGHGDFLLDSGNFFRPFETVDSHIKGILEEPPHQQSHLSPPSLPPPRLQPQQTNKRRIHETYAPTLPIISSDLRTNPLNTPLGKVLNDPEDNHPLKRAKIDHVNDFLHQISFITSPEDEKRTINCFGIDKICVSPLVKKFVDLGFSRFGDEKTTTNNSSFLNDLSLDKIVDAILDTSNESDKCKNISTMVNVDVEIGLQNELNETHEENLLNTMNEHRAIVTNADDDDDDRGDAEEEEEGGVVHSPDSGFKSSATEYSHQLEGNFTCRCNNPMVEKTIITIDETFNERCVDEINTRKRSSSSPLEKDDVKRFNPNQSSFDDDDDADLCFTLKRQRCIRRRRDDDNNKKIKAETVIKQTLKQQDDEDSFVISTPIIGPNRKFRRCLLFESPSTSSSLSESISSSSIGSDIRGLIDLNIRWENQELSITVIRCRDLCRLNGTQINAYVKVTLGDGLKENTSSSRNSGSRKRNGTLQRTTVQANSCKPYFNSTFKFPLAEDVLFHKRIHIEVWHRDRVTRTSEFLGCMSFDARNAFNKEIAGSYRLLPQSLGRTQNVPLRFNDLEKPSATTTTTTMCESHSSIDDVMSLEELENELKRSTNTSKAVLMEQQKYADENLFLRYLELDPVEGPDAIPAALQRKATGNKNGRTPFTHTKKLIKAPRAGFGFSVVWTHPPRIERVEKGLPADKAGILPGDYIIFVDKHNVVMMPEIDILNLIRSCGSQLTLEIFRRNTSRNGSVPSVRRLNSSGTCSTTGLPVTSNLVQRRPSTVCSTTNTASVDLNTNRKKLQLPQVTFSSERTSNSPEENRKKAMYQLISKEQQYATGLQFALTRFVSALAERRDLITPAEHKVLFQNSDEILRITEDILDTIIHEDGEFQLHLLLRTYHSKLNEITSAYKRYCSGIKKADCILVNKTKNCQSEFVRFLHTPSIPRRRPDITTFIHKPLEHFRDILMLLTVIQCNTRPNHEDYPVINQIIHDLQLTYKEITAEAGLMEPMGEGRPLLTVQDLENRLVFTKCKPFVLNKPGRQWIFGGDLGRVEGRNVRQYWTLLFSDLLLFAKVSRDRVLFIIEDPLPLAHITDMFFNIRKKDTEFRIIVNPAGRKATSPTVHCGPDLSRTPKKNASKRTIVLRAPTIELKAVWQNLLQRQIFQVNAGMDGSSFSSPIESPDAPITSSVATLQSAESLSYRRQTPLHNINENSYEIQKQIDAIIEHKCKQFSKNTNGKGNAIHLEKWMKSQLDTQNTDDPEPITEEWTEEMLRKRSEELQLIDCQGNITTRSEVNTVSSNTNTTNTTTTTTSSSSKKNEIPNENDNYSEDHDQSPSKSTTTESQVTVRSSPLVPETVSVCRQCHKNCLSASNSNKSNSQSIDNKDNNNKDENDNKDEEDDWSPLLLMGLTALNPTTSLVKLDPFIVPSQQNKNNMLTTNHQKTLNFNNECNCPTTKLIEFNSNDVDISDDSPQTEEHPYHSLSSSNLTLRRYGTVSSLDRVGSDDNDDKNYSSDEDHDDDGGIDNEAFYQSAIRSWTARAGSFVAEKMAFFGGFSDDYKNSGKFFERYLKTNPINGDDLQDEETSGATSGEEIWGTPTSGGDLDDPLSSPNMEGNKSPYDGSISSDNGDDTELMMDELLMTPPLTGAIIRGLLPRRTLEPLIEEDFSETYSSSASATPTEPSISPEQGKGIGDVADTCSIAVAAPTINADQKVPKSISLTPQTELEQQENSEQMTTTISKIPRSESYRRIVEAAEELEGDLNFFNRFKPTVKFINIERIPKTKSVKILEFFNMRRERRIHNIPEGRQLIKLFSKEGTISDDVPTSYSEKPTSPPRLKDKQVDGRFWRQLSRRRGNKLPNNT